MCLCSWSDAQVIMVMVSDGRANVPLAISNGTANEDDPKLTRDELKEEVLNTARGLRGLAGKLQILRVAHDKR